MRPVLVRERCLVFGVLSVSVRKRSGARATSDSNQKKKKKRSRRDADRKVGRDPPSASRGVSCFRFRCGRGRARHAPGRDFQDVTRELAQHPPPHEFYAGHELVPLDLLVEGLGQSVVRLASRRFAHEG